MGEQASCALLCSCLQLVQIQLSSFFCLMWSFNTTCFLRGCLKDVLTGFQSFLQLLHCLGSVLSDVCCSYHPIFFFGHTIVLTRSCSVRYAWYKLFNLSRAFNKNLTAADTQLMATSVVLAALSIPPYESSRSENEAELDRERSMRMANILGFSVVCALRSSPTVVHLSAAGIVVGMQQQHQTS